MDGHDRRHAFYHRPIFGRPRRQPACVDATTAGVRIDVRRRVVRATREAVTMAACVQPTAVVEPRRDRTGRLAHCLVAAVTAPRDASWNRSAQDGKELD